MNAKSDPAGFIGAFLIKNIVMSNKEKGLYPKYKIEKIVGLKRVGEGFSGEPIYDYLTKPVSEGAEYFVLRLDSGSSDPVHIEACKKAVLVYADEIESHLPELAKDLREKYGSIHDVKR